MIALVLHLLIAVLAQLFLAYLGLPVTRLVWGRRVDRYGIRTTITGLALLTTFAWYWISVTGRGLSIGLPLLVAVNAPLVVASTRTGPGWHWRTDWRRDWRGPMRACVPAATLLLCMTAIYGLYYGDVLTSSVTGRLPAPAALGNVDLASYALNAQHLMHHGFGDPGRIVGIDMGAFARADAFGAFALLAAVSLATGLSASTILMPVLLLGTALCAAGLCTALESWRSWPWQVSVAIAAASCSTGMYFYSVGQGFFAQIFGSAAAYCLLSDVLALISDTETATWRSAATRACRTVPPLICLLMIYPHMAFLAPPVLLGVVFLASWWDRTPRLAQQSVVATASLAAGLGLAGLLVATRTQAAVQRAIMLQDGLNGWTLGPVTVMQALGVSPWPTETGRTSTKPLPLPVRLHQLLGPRLIVALACVLLAVAFARAVITHVDASVARVMGPALAFVTITLASYYVFLGRYGEGYQQWKWLSFWQPLLIAGALALVTLSVLQIGPRRLGSAFPYALAPALAMVALGVATTGARERAHPLIMDELTARLSSTHYPSTLNVQVDTPGPYWDTMWVAFFIPASKLYLSSSSQYAMTHDPTAPTLHRRVEAGPFQLEPPDDAARPIGPPAPH